MGIETDIDVINKEISESVKKADNLKAECLRHYLLNLFLYHKLPEDEREGSAIVDELNKWTIILKKLGHIRNKMTRNNVVEKMMINKNNSKRKCNSSNPRSKYKKISEKLDESTKNEYDYKINSKNSNKKNIN